MTFWHFCVESKSIVGVVEDGLHRCAVTRGAAVAAMPLRPQGRHMTEKTKTDAAEAIRDLVWSGFYTASDIYETITEDVYERVEIDTAWVETEIQSEFARKAEDEKNWPAETDCDRLNRVFGTLNDAGIIALQNAGYTQSEGLEDVTQAYYDLGAARSGRDGYCFYHGQDLERAVNGQGIMLTFGDIDGDDTRGVEVGRRIVAVLEDAGFAVKWPGTIQQRIEVPVLKWQRRSRV